MFIKAKGVDLPQVDQVMNFRVEYVRPQSTRCLGREAAKWVLNKQDDGLFRKFTKDGVYLKSHVLCRGGYSNFLCK